MLIFPATHGCSQFDGLLKVQTDRLKAVSDERRLKQTGIESK